MFQFNSDLSVIRGEENRHETLWAKVGKATWWHGFTGVTAPSDFELWRGTAKQETLLFEEAMNAEHSVLQFLGVDDGISSEEVEESERGNLLLYRDTDGRQLRAVLVVDVQREDRQIWPGIRVYFDQHNSDWHVYADLEKISSVEAANAAFEAVRQCYRELTAASKNGFRGASELRYQPFGWSRKRIKV